MILTAVAPLQGQPALEGLEVVENCLGFDRPASIPATDQGVPRPQITLDRKRQLGRPAEAWVESGPKPIEESLLAGIPDRIATRVGSESHVQSDGRAVRCQLPDRGTSRSGLESLHARPGETARLADLLSAQARSTPPADQVRTDACLVLEGASSRARHGSVPDGHGSMLHQYHSLPLTSTLSGRCDVRINRPAAQRPESGWSAVGLHERRADPCLVVGLAVVTPAQHAMAGRKSPTSGRTNPAR